MRVTPIRIVTGKGGLYQMKASFRKNWIHYLQEALGLAIFMISACFFGSLLESTTSGVHYAINSPFVRLVVTGILMGGTALFIFYSPWTAPSGSQINPAVTLTFLRLGRMCQWDAMFFIIFQFIGGTIAVYVMQWLMGTMLTASPVRSAVTVPGMGAGTWSAFFMEFFIAFVTMVVVLFTTAHEKLKKYTRIFAGCLVCTWVIVAGPISGFGMNPARSFASSLPANIWTAAWIYMTVPVLGMFAAAEFFLRYNQVRDNMKQRTLQKRVGMM